MSEGGKQQIHSGSIQDGDEPRRLVIPKTSLKKRKQKPEVNIELDGDKQFDSSRSKSNTEDSPGVKGSGVDIGSEAEGFSFRGERPGLGYGASPEGLFDTSGLHRIQSGVSFERNPDEAEEEGSLGQFQEASAPGDGGVRPASLYGKAGVIPTQGNLRCWPQSKVGKIETRWRRGTIVPGQTPTMRSWSLGMTR